MKTISDKRLLINATVNGYDEVFLLDTGASVGLIDKYHPGLKQGRKYKNSLIGAGGDIKATHMCDTFVEIGNKKVAQFIMADISNIQESIEHETGYKIVGIISLPQMLFLGLNINIATGEYEIGV